MSKRPSYLYTVEAVRWFDRVNGNTYHACRVTRHRDGACVRSAFTYGYDLKYRQTALELMAEKKWLPVKYRQDAEWLSYERENRYPILWCVSDGRKKDVMALACGG